MKDFENFGVQELSANKKREASIFSLSKFFCKKNKNKTINKFYAL